MVVVVDVRTLEGSGPCCCGCVWLAARLGRPSGPKATGKPWPWCSRCVSLVARVRPSGLKATAWTRPVKPVRAVTCPVAIVHSDTVPSESAAATVEPSGLKATETTSASPVKTVVVCLAARSHRRTVTSPPLARVRPSGSNATDQTRSVWPIRTTSVVKVATGALTRARGTRAAPAVAVVSSLAGGVCAAR